jgi:hypothetical protein
LPEWLDLTAFWRRNPPPGVMLQILARLWGWKPPEPELPPMSFAEACAKDGDMFRGIGRFFPANLDGGPRRRKGSRQ